MYTGNVATSSGLFFCTRQICDIRLRTKNANQFTEILDWSCNEVHLTEITTINVGIILPGFRKRWWLVNTCCKEKKQFFVVFHQQCLKLCSCFLLLKGIANSYGDKWHVYYMYISHHLDKKNYASYNCQQNLLHFVKM